MNIWLTILLVLVVSVFIFHLSSLAHKAGYVLFIICFFALASETIQGKIEKVIEKNDVFNILYELLLWVLVIYGIIGIVEAVIRIFSSNFTFGHFIVSTYKKYEEIKKLEKQGRRPGQLDLNSFFPQIADTNEYEYIFNQCKNDYEKEQFMEDWKRYLIDLQAHAFINLKAEPEQNKEELYFSFDEWYRKNEIWRTSGYYHAYYEEQHYKRYKKMAEWENAQMQEPAPNVNIDEKVAEKEEKLDLLDLAGLLSLKRDILDSEIERKVYKELTTFINTGEYVIIPHIAFREVFTKNAYLADRFYKKVIGMHFDFGVYDKRLNPIMFIEIWGEDHFTQKDIMERDRFKQELLNKYELKLAVIDASKTIPDEEIRGIVVQAIKKVIPSRDSCRTYCPECNSLMKIKLNSKTKEYFYGCTKYDKKIKGQSGCSKTLSISEVAPLYIGIPENNIK